VQADDERAAGANGARQAGERGAPAILVEVGERDVAAQDEVERPVRRRVA
jgi:hypothetical protein